MKRPPAEALYEKSPGLGSPGLNVNVAASLLGQFGNDNVLLQGRYGTELSEIKKQIF
jgi:hypothetical protein